MMETNPSQSLEGVSSLLLDAYVAQISAVATLAQREVVESRHGTSQTRSSGKEVCLAATRATGGLL